MVQVEYGRKTDDEWAAARAKKQQNTRKEKRATQAKKGKGKQISHSSSLTPIGTSTAVFDPQIDPALLVGNGLSTITSIVDTDHHQDIGTFIGENEMQLLISNGYPSTIPINGPGDGLPRYYVPTAAVDELKRIIASQAQASFVPSPQTISLSVPPNMAVRDSDQRNPSNDDNNQPRRSQRRMNVATETPNQMTTRSQRIRQKDPQ